MIVYYLAATTTVQIQICFFVFRVPFKQHNIKHEILIRKLFIIVYLIVDYSTFSCFFHIKLSHDSPKAIMISPQHNIF